MVEGLPRSLAREPYVRALGMRVYPVNSSRRELVVVGGSVPHTVHAVNDNLFICDCKAAQFKGTCAHVLAVLSLKEKPNMAFTVDRPTGKSQGEVILPVPLPRKTMYGGILLGYTKEYDQTDFKTGRVVIDEKTGNPVRLRTFRFLCTHTAAGDKWIKLDTPTEAKVKAKMKWFYDAKTGVKSTLFAIVECCTGTAQADDLHGLSDAEIGEAVDGSVGGVCAFLAGPIEKPDKGYIGNFIDGQTFEKPDANLAKLGAAMATKLEFSYTENEDEPRRYVRSPKGATMEPGAAPAPQASQDNVEDEVPF